MDEQDRFTTCFKSMWNNPLLSFRIKEEKTQTVLITRQFEKLAAPSAAKPVTKPVT